MRQMKARTGGHHGRTVALIGAMVLAMSLSASAGPPRQPPCYRVAHVIYGPTSEAHVYPRMITEDGMVVGSYRPSPLAAQRPFYWTEETGFVPIPLLPAFSEGWVNAANEDGLLVGSLSRVGTDNGFVYNIHTGQWHLLIPHSDGGDCEVTGINSQGVVCGFRSLDDGGEPQVPPIGFIWMPDAGYTDFVDVGVSKVWAINDKNEAIGTTYTNDGLPFRWNENSWESLQSLSGHVSIPRSFNKSGQIVGTSNVPDGGAHGDPRAVLWEPNGTIHQLAQLEGDDVSHAFGCNDFGVIVGSGLDKDSGLSYHHGILWIDGVAHPMTQLVSSSATIVRVDLVFDVNNNGLIVGYGIYEPSPPYSEPAFILQPVDSFLGDVDGDCDVSVDDLLQIVLHWTESGPSIPSDVNEDEIVNIDDMLIVLENWID